MQAVDFFSSYDADMLDTWDADLASGGPVLLPSTPFSTPSHPRLVAIAGKQGFLYLLDPADLGGMKQGPNGGDRVVARFGPFGGVWGQVAAWPGDGGYLYLLPPNSYLGGDGDVRVLKWGIDGAGKPSLAEVGRSTESRRLRFDGVGRLVGRHQVGHRRCCGSRPAMRVATGSCARTTRSR